MPGPSALVCVNGDCCEGTLQQLLAIDFDVIVAVDGGLRHAQALGRVADWLIGDMDSVDEQALAAQQQAGTRLLKHPTEKDATDLELALQHVVALGIAEVVLAGISGGRLDHTLANLLLLGKQDWPFAIRFLSQEGNGVIVTSEHPFNEQLPMRSELSLLPLSAVVTGVSCSGLYYPLADATFALGSTLGISNVVVDESVSVTLDSGKLLLLHNPQSESQSKPQPRPQPGPQPKPQPRTPSD